MARVDLAVDEFDVLGFEVFDVFDECVFAGVAGLAEHAFAEENFSEADAIESADEFSMLPYFRAMSVSFKMKFSVGLFYFIGDPGSFLSSSCGGLAVVDNGFEIFVDGEFEGFFPEELAHAPTHFQFVGEEHEPGVGAPP